MFSAIDVIELNRFVTILFSQREKKTGLMVFDIKNRVFLNGIVSLLIIGEN